MGRIKSDYNSATAMTGKGVLLSVCKSKNEYG